MGMLIDGDCGGLVPPCWQELHYLFAGIGLGVALGLLLFPLLRYYFVNYGRI